MKKRAILSPAASADRYQILVRHRLCTRSAPVRGRASGMMKGEPAISRNADVNHLHNRFSRCCASSKPLGRFHPEGQPSRAGRKVSTKASSIISSFACRT